MDFIPQYIKGKNNPDSITYDCPQLEPILAPTYGCIVYQEQVMQIVRDLVDIRLDEAIFCEKQSKRAMSCRKSARISYMVIRTKACRAVSPTESTKTANKIYDEMIDFAKYAFNKSHAAAYAVVSYQTAWLKCYYRWNSWQHL